MKILELHYSTAAAGAERLVIDLSNELSRNNELVLCTTDDDSILENSYYKNEISARIKYPLSSSVVISSPVTKGSVFNNCAAATKSATTRSTNSFGVE